MPASQTRGIVSPVSTGMTVLAESVPLPTVADGDPLPGEFRIFRSGVNRSTKGEFIFDETAAQSVMADYATRGVDVPIDLAHDSLSSAARAHRDDADDARGWFRLQLRRSPDGAELWAVGVSWTPDGERRLRQRTQRYISPAFDIDPKTGRILRLFNVALVASPATLEAPALVARAEESDMGSTIASDAVRAARASASPTELIALGMSAEMATRAVEVLKTQDGEAALAMVEALLVEILGGEGGETAAEAPPEDVAGQGADTPPEAQALSVRLSASESANVALSAEVRRLRGELDRVEHTERVALVGELVKLGAELPSTAWADPDALRPTQFLSEIPLVALRSRVEAFRARGPVEGHTPPSVSAPIVELSAIEREAYERLPEGGAREKYLALRRGMRVSK